MLDYEGGRDGNGMFHSKGLVLGIGTAKVDAVTHRVLFFFFLSKNKNAFNSQGNKCSCQENI